MAEQQPTSQDSTTSAAAAAPAASPVFGFTENMARTYHATGSYCLDLFFDTVPGIETNRLHGLLQNAWSEDPLMTLKLIFQLGDPRTGKNDRTNLYVALQWLYENHPDTLMLNLKYLPRFSCYKALLDLLQLVCCSSDALDDKRASGKGRRKPDYRSSMEQGTPRLVQLFFQSDEFADFFHTKGYTLTNSFTQEPFRGRRRNKRSRPNILIWRHEDIRNAFAAFVEQFNEREVRDARQERKQSKENLRQHAKDRLASDAKYRALWEAVANIFATDLRSEKKQLEEHPDQPLAGLAAKWAPTLTNAHDRHTLIVDGIVERMYPAETYKLPHGTHKDYMSFVRDWYRKELSKQRGAAQVPEHFIGSGEWHSVNYNRMASKCRQMHGHIYQKHDKERYNKYLDDAKEEAKVVLQQRAENKDASLSNKIKAGVLLPHTIIRNALKHNHDAESVAADEANLQWLQLVQDTRESGRLPLSVSICDVSGSMSGTPMDVAIALSLLVAELAPQGSQWRGKVITFSEVPKLVNVPEPTIDNLGERARLVQGMDWGYNTDFQAVFDLLLETAKFWNIPNSGMPATLFCFSDMEFDEASGRSEWSTDYEQIQTKYEKSGYTMPQIVFWNLRSSLSKPAVSAQKGVTLLSGFGAGLLKSFLAGNLEDFTPYTQMVEALNPYECLTLAPSRTSAAVPTNDGAGDVLSAY